MIALADTVTEMRCLKHGLDAGIGAPEGGRTVSARAIVIGGVSSGVGKTSLALGIVRAAVRRGLRVQTFKVGPDFLDPSYLAVASGRTCYNLDGWMTGRNYVCDLFARASADADLAIIEGVMGLFDGASPTSLEGSTAEIAAWFGAPVLLVASAHGAARSLAATVKGFAQFEPTVRVAGVIANQCGGDQHRQWLRESLGAAALPPLMGAVPGALLPSAGKPPPWPGQRGPRVFAPVRDRRPGGCVREAPGPGVHPCPGADRRRQMRAPRKRSRWGLQGPRAARRGSVRESPWQRMRRFTSTTPTISKCSAIVGARLVEFSPLRDSHLPEGVGGIYLGGGYPEIHAAALAADTTMLADIRRHAAAGKAIYAECGGLMYLGRSVATLDGKRHDMTGVLPVETAMADRLRSLGYVEATAKAGTIWSGEGDATAPVLRGHEFHYSQITSDGAPADGWHPAYRLRRRDGREELAGFARGRVLASYVHARLCPPAPPRPGDSSSFAERNHERTGQQNRDPDGRPRQPATGGEPGFHRDRRAGFGPPRHTVVPTFFSLARPSIEDQVARLAGEGVRRIVLMPYFLYTGQHVARDIPALLEECGRKFPQVQIEVLPTLEGEPGLVEIVAERLAAYAPSAPLPTDGAAIERRSHEIIDALSAPRLTPPSADRAARDSRDGRLLLRPDPANPSAGGGGGHGGADGAAGDRLRREHAGGGNHAGRDRSAVHY